VVYAAALNREHRAVAITAFYKQRDEGRHILSPLTPSPAKKVRERQARDFIYAAVGRHLYAVMTLMISLSVPSSDRTLKLAT
jgi:hypothetical protein